MNKAKTILKYTVLGILSLFVLFFLLGVGIGLVQGATGRKPDVAATPAVPVVTPTIPTTQEPDLLAMATDFQMDTSNLNLVYSNFTDPNQLAEFDWSQVGYSITYTLKVMPGQASNDARVAFAHEYYHYMWYIHPDIKTRVMPSLDALYAGDTLMHHRMQPYVAENEVPGSVAFDNELFAIYCTETSTTSLPPVISTECLKWESLGSITAYRSL